jgi:Tol biopolymer transport system component
MMRKLGLVVAVSVLVAQSMVGLVGAAESAGAKILFYSERDGNAEVYLMDTDGSGLQRLTTNPANEWSPAGSPDGTLIAFESERDDPHPALCFPNCTTTLYLMRADGSAERRLMDLPGSEGHPDWSPDGRSLVFQADRNGDGKFEIYTIPAAGGEPTLVLGDSFDNMAPDWSPVGDEIAFSSDRDGQYDVFAVRVDGTGLRKIADTGLDDYFPAWAPDGGSVAFFAARWPTVRQDLFVVGSDGTGLRRLTNTQRVVDEDPSWSPDGQRIVFQSDRDGNFEIYSMGVDGSDIIRLTRQVRGDYWPSYWSPASASALALDAPAPADDDHAIAFVSTRSGRAQIYTMNPDGSDPVRLTNEPYDNYSPAWSPDGRRIAYYLHLSWQSWALVVMNADGTGRRQITESAGCATCAMGPHWSPDGTRIGFSVEPNPRPTCEMKATELAVINADGAGCRRLTNNAANDLFYGWSPDGATILFVSNRDGLDQVYLMGEDGSSVRRLTDVGSTNNMPAWSPDGARIAFVSNRDGNDDIYVMDADGSNVIRITSDPAHDWMPIWSADGTEILFASDRGGSQLDIYAVRPGDLAVRRLTTAGGYDYEATWRR